MRERRGAYRVLARKPEGKSPLGKHWRRCEDNIKMEIQQVGWGAWNGFMWLRKGKGGGLL
jgi:hypothetical protein